MKTRPSILCATHQMSRNKRKDPVGSTVRYGMMNQKWYRLILDAIRSVYGDTGCYFGGNGSL